MIKFNLTYTNRKLTPMSLSFHYKLVTVRVCVFVCVCTLNKPLFQVQVFTVLSTIHGVLLVKRGINYTSTPFLLFCNLIRN